MHDRRVLELTPEQARSIGKALTEGRIERVDGGSA